MGALVVGMYSFLFIGGKSYAINGFTLLRHCAEWFRFIFCCPLYHGYTNNSLEWLLSSDIVKLSNEYNLAVVLPSAENSFYLNGKGAGRAYGTYVGEELVNYTRRIFGLSQKREDTFVGGISMGGFGAIHTGLEYNRTFGKIMAKDSCLSWGAACIPAFAVSNLHGFRKRCAW